MRRLIFLFSLLFILLFNCTIVSSITIHCHWLQWKGEQVKDVKAITVASQSYNNFSLPLDNGLIYTTYYIFKYDEPQGKRETYLDGVEVFIYMAHYWLNNLPFGLPPKFVTRKSVEVKFFRFNHKPLLHGWPHQERIYGLSDLKQGQSIRFTIGRRKGENFAKVSLIDNHIIKWTKEFIYPNFEASGHIIIVRHGVESTTDNFMFQGKADNLWFQYLNDEWHLIPWNSGKDSPYNLPNPCNINIKNWNYGKPELGIGGKVVWQCGE